MATIGTLERVSAATLSQLILAQQAAETATTGSSEPPIAIIDVRDDGTLPSNPINHHHPTLLTPCNQTTSAGTSKAQKTSPHAASTPCSLP